MKIVFPAIFESFATRADGSIKLILGSQELDTTHAAELLKLRNKYVKCLLSDSNITEIESNLVDNEPISGTKKKSPSKRLRSVLYVQWEQSGLDIDFELFYATEMEKLIDSIKTKLI